MKQFVFFYVMKDKPEKIGPVVPKHVNYWNDAKPAHYSGGPFSDKSGGMIQFMADDEEFARDLAMNDPFVVENLIETMWIKQWMTI